MDRRRKLHPSTAAFSLVEAALVLGVIGLVIGGIWVAASQASNGRKINEVVQGVLQIVEGVRTAYIGMPWPDQVVDSSSVNITSWAIYAKVVPADWIRTNIIVTPFGYDPSATTANAVKAAVTASGDFILIDLAGTENGNQGIDAKSCTAIIRKINAAATQSRLIHVNVTTLSSGSIGYSVPFSSDTVNCTSPFYYMRFQFAR